jgi:hypothetical protein
MVVIDGSDRVTFEDEEVTSDRGIVLSCRVGAKVVWVPRHRVLSGSTVSRTGDRGSS